jgi:hypothetical protein
MKMINSREVVTALVSFLSKSVHISTKDTQQLVRLGCGNPEKLGEMELVRLAATVIITPSQTALFPYFSVNFFSFFF